MNSIHHANVFCQPVDFGWSSNGATMARNLLAPGRDENKGINGLSIHSRDTCLESLAGQGIQLLPRSRPGNLDCLAQVGGVGAPSPTAPVSGSNFPNSGEFLTSALPRPNPFPIPSMQPSLLGSSSPSPQSRSLGCHMPQLQPGIRLAQLLHQHQSVGMLGSLGSQ